MSSQLYALRTLTDNVESNMTMSRPEPVGPDVTPGLTEIVHGLRHSAPRVIISRRWVGDVFTVFPVHDGFQFTKDVGMGG